MLIANFPFIAEEYLAEFTLALLRSLPRTADAYAARTTNAGTELYQHLYGRAHTDLDYGDDPYYEHDLLDTHPWGLLPESYADSYTCHPLHHCSVLMMLLNPSRTALRRLAQQYVRRTGCYNLSHRNRVWSYVETLSSTPLNLHKPSEFIHPANRVNTILDVLAYEIEVHPYIDSSDEELLHGQYVQFIEDYRARLIKLSIRNHCAVTHVFINERIAQLDEHLLHLDDLS